MVALNAEMEEVGYGRKRKEKREREGGRQRMRWLNKV